MAVSAIALIVLAAPGEVPTRKLKDKPPAWFESPPLAQDMVTDLATNDMPREIGGFGGMLVDGELL